MRIGIIGAGFTGALLAATLLRQERGGGAALADTVFLIERSGTFGKGLAYGTQHGGHLLNVRVANMSAFEDDPSHFLRWLWANDFAEQPAASVPPSGHAFASRGIYGRYIESVLNEGASAAPLSRVAALQDSVTAIQPGPVSGLELMLESGSRLAVDAAVLCVGNFPAALPITPVVAPGGEQRLVNGPWELERIDAIPHEAPVAIMGTGLTMVDAVLSLVERGHKGPITAISRRGLLPHVHAQTRPWPRFLAERPCPTTVNALLRRIRDEAARAEDQGQGYGWRSVVDAIRPDTQAIWQSLDNVERQRFLRHARVFWEVHRHRMPPQVAEVIEGLRACGRLRLVQGRLQRLDLGPDGVRILAKARASGTEVEITVHSVINCAGPRTNYDAIRDPLVMALLEGGLARPDPCRLGLDTGEGERLVAADGSTALPLFALGPPTRGRFWEITAVPDIRRQVAAFVARLAAERQAPPCP